MNHYEEYILGLSSRLLSLVNTSSYSSSYGCFDKNYWHFKTSDFPNASKQQGITGLAKFYNFNHQSNKLYKSKKVLDLISGGLSFLKNIQKSDGSFDEWYFNERGWAGPTGYLVHAVYDTYQEVKDDISDETKSIVISILQSSKTHLIESDEKHPLANHIAIAMLALIEINEVLPDTNLIRRYDELLSQLEGLLSNEGWTLEYDGADPGYQSATVSFLARIHRINQCKRIEAICIKSLSFIESFCYPDGTFSGNVGSRHTTNIFYFGVEYFREIESGSRISNWIEENFKNHTLPLDHDDNYFIYRVHELYDAYKETLNKSPKSSKGVIYKDNNFLEAGIETTLKENTYIVINHKRGRIIQAYNIKDKSLLIFDNGILVKNSKKVYTSLWIKGKYEDNFLTEIKEKHFTVLSFIMFRLFFTLFARNRNLAYWFKNMIKHVLIFSKKSGPHKYSRKIQISNSSIEIIDEVNMANFKESILVYGDHFYSRYVPQSSLFNSNKFNDYFNPVEKKFIKNTSLKRVIQL